MLEMNATVIVENEQNANHLILFETKNNSNYILQIISFRFALQKFTFISYISNTVLLEWDIRYL